MGGAGGAFGVLLGGVLTDLLSWQWILFINVPIGLTAAVLTPRYVEEGRSAIGTRNFDVAGALSVTLGLVAIVYAIVRTDVNGWGSAQTIVVLAVGLLLIGLFLAIEGRFAKRPLMPLHIFRSRPLSGANAVVFLLGAGMFGMWFFVSLYLQQVLGYSPLEAGLAFLPFTLGIIVGAGVSQPLARRIPVHLISLIGIGLAVLGLFILRGAGVDGTYLANLLPGIIPMSIGMGMTFLPLTLIATTGVAASDAGLASGLFNTSQQVGGALGLAILSTIAADHTTGLLEDLGRSPNAQDRVSALVDGFHVAYLGGIGLLLLGAVLRSRDMAAIDPDAQPAVVGA
jgi:predicted MFS family arabinose efflux permease